MLIFQSLPLPVTMPLFGHEYSDNVACMKVNGRDMLFLFDTYTEDFGETCRSRLYSFDVTDGQEVCPITKVVYMYIYYKDII